MGDNFTNVKRFRNAVYKSPKEGPAFNHNVVLWNLGQFWTSYSLFQKPLIFGRSFRPHFVRSIVDPEWKFKIEQSSNIGIYTCYVKNTNRKDKKHQFWSAAQTEEKKTTCKNAPFFLGVAFKKRHLKHKGTSMYMPNYIQVL